ncbi:MAG: class I SAM-dependent methyltransferase, partial [Pseudomonadota bacterium]|nr:class I SAM-dependent methyltransferase [Pseudomonadota bacterium]
MKEHDIRPAGLFEEFHVRNEADTKHFFSDGKNRENFSCPGCGEYSYTELYTVNSFPIVNCSVCDSRFVSPRPTEQALAQFYREATSQKFLADVWYPSTAEGRMEKLIRPRANQIAELIKSHAIDVRRITDIGAGYGLLLETLKKIFPEFELAAVEPNTPFVEHLSTRSYKVFNGLVSEAAKDPSWQNSADLVTAFEVFEHVQSPVDFVRDMTALIKPGGFLMFTGVNGNGFDILVLGSAANAICPPQHL